MFKDTKKNLRAVKHENNDAPATFVKNLNLQPRYHLLDTIRGILIIGVIIFHFIIDLDTFGFDVSYFDAATNVFINYVGMFGRAMFILIAGICCNLSHNNLKRGSICLACAIGISLVTYFIVPDLFIYMGILHLLGLCMVLHAGIIALSRLIFKYDIRSSTATAVIGAIVMTMLYIITHQIYVQERGLWLFTYVPLNRCNLYGTFVGYVLGFGGYAGKLSSDYFPLIPWIFVFFAGVFVGQFFRNRTVPKIFERDFCKPLTYIGRKTLLIYLAHQPIMFALAYLLSLIAN